MSLARSRVGPYRLLSRAARSGEGEVWRAEDAKGRAVALKLVELSRADDERRAALARIERVAKLWRRLDHPAIVRLVAAGRAGDFAFVATEWVVAPTLDAVLAAGGPLPAARALEIAVALAEALEHAHARGVLHRDLKPANVFAPLEGRARLNDFGLARDGDAGVSTAGVGGTKSGEAVGTFAYMAPEAARDGRLADARTDIFGLGATLFHMLAGRPPHAGRTLGDAVRSCLAGAPPLPPEAGGGGFVGAVVARALALEPGRRYAGAREILDDLRVACTLEGVG